MYIKCQLNINYTTDLSKKLFECNEDEVMSVWDGMYVYIQKSANFSFQTDTFSMHKHRNLVKLMMFVRTNGYIIDCFGPYLANGNSNDAKI